jgi:hypothetical protein
MTIEMKRALAGLAVLVLGVAAQGSLDASMNRPRPKLRAALASIPYQLEQWVGRDEPLDADILERTQADEYLNRVYEDTRHPGRSIKVWINYSNQGLNLRHSPEVCLPSGGWTKVEAQTRELNVRAGDGAAQTVTRLCYSQADFVQGIGFWYYIFGEGPMERFARTLPIGSRSSHGRATRGSGMTIELFYPGEFDPDGATVAEFAEALLSALEPILPEDRAAYHVP